jgi:hypothetical protein
LNLKLKLKLVEQQKSLQLLKGQQLLDSKSHVTTQSFIYEYSVYILLAVVAIAFVCVAFYFMGDLGSINQISSSSNAISDQVYEVNRSNIAGTQELFNAQTEVIMKHVTDTITFSTETSRKDALEILDGLQKGFVTLDSKIDILSTHLSLLTRHMFLESIRSQNVEIVGSQNPGIIMSEPVLRMLTSGDLISNYNTLLDTASAVSTIADAVLPIL